MSNLALIDPVDYLVIGHVTVDLTPQGPILGGSASYAALTARALGLRVGIVTASGNEIPRHELDGIPLVSGSAENSTTFENIYSPDGRVQFIRHVAPAIDFSMVPAEWRKAKIIHLAPVAQEVSPQLPDDFHPTLLGMTPQGWMRRWDVEGKVTGCSWDVSAETLAQAGAVVFSVEDVGRDEDLIESLSHSVRVLAVTEGAAGVRLFWHGDSRRFRPPQVSEVDPTGAGDIFATAFFVRLLNTRDPWEAARFANRVAAISVTRPGIAGIPTAAEIQKCMVEIST